MAENRRFLRVKFAKCLSLQDSIFFDFLGLRRWMFVASRCDVTGFELMQDWRAQYLGLAKFPTNLTAAEIDEMFTLADDIAQVMGVRRTPLTRLGLVLQIGFLRLTGRSLNSVQMIPSAVLRRTGQTAGIAAPQLASIRSIYRR